MGNLIERQDFKVLVDEYFSRIREYDLDFHGVYSTYIVDNFNKCLLRKSEYVDYGFLESDDFDEIQTREVSNAEEILIAGHSFILAVFGTDYCDDNEIVNLYKSFKEIEKKRGWKKLEFDKTCLSLLGVGAEIANYPFYLPREQRDVDYN